MAAEAKMLNGTDIREFIEKHFKKENTFWFHKLRTKVDRSSRLCVSITRKVKMLNNSGFAGTIHQRMVVNL